MKTKNIITYVSSQDQILVWREMQRMAQVRKAKAHFEKSLELDTYHLKEVKKESTHEC